MDLDLTADEHDVATAFARFFERESPTDRVREVEATGFDQVLWSELCAMGAVGLALPEVSGGGGAGLIEVVLVAEAAGRHLACVPLIEACAAAWVLATVGGQDDALDRALAGDRPMVLSPLPAQDGTAVLVPGGAIAPGVIALDGDDLVLAEGPPGAGVADLGFMAGADRALHGDGVTRTVLASGAAARQVWDRAVGAWRVGTAAVCAGIAAEALDVACAYARTREQFGVPIGSFQALQQTLADVVMASDGARLLAREAAWQHDHGISSWLQAADVAFVHAAETAVQSAEACLHVHGGYGFTLEYDAQLHLRRAKALQLLGGDPEHLLERIGAAAGGVG